MLNASTRSMIFSANEPASRASSGSILLRWLIPQAKEPWPVPAGAGDRKRNLGEARIGLALPGKTFLQHRHPLHQPDPLASKYGPRPHIDRTPGHGPLSGLLSGFRAIEQTLALGVE